jgi:hypothetical protein
MKGKPARGRSKTKRNRKITLEDLRKVMVMRSFAVVIEKKAYELCAADDAKNVRFDAGVKAIRTLLAQLDAINAPQLEAEHDSPRSVRTHDCWDGYELCSDHVCRVWCSG